MKKRIVNTKQIIKNRGVNKLEFKKAEGRIYKEDDQGEEVTIDENGLTTIQEKAKDIRKCLFEFIYLARPDSIMNGKSVYSLRHKAGQLLYKEEETQADLVIAAPDSGIVAAIGYAEESKIPYKIGLIKNRYVGRTFIEPTQKLREQ